MGADRGDETAAAQTQEVNMKTKTTKKARTDENDFEALDRLAHSITPESATGH